MTSSPSNQTQTSKERIRLLGVQNVIPHGQDNIYAYSNGFTADNIRVFSQIFARSSLTDFVPSLSFDQKFYYRIDESFSFNQADFFASKQGVLDVRFTTSIDTISVNGGLPSSNGGVPSSVPEPTSIALFGLGLLGFTASRRITAK